MNCFPLKLFPSLKEILQQQPMPGPWASSFLCLCRGLFCSSLISSGTQHKTAPNDERRLSLAQSKLHESRELSRFCYTPYSQGLCMIHISALNKYFLNKWIDKWGYALIWLRSAVVASALLLIRHFAAFSE